MINPPYKFEITLDLLTRQVYPIGTDKFDYDFSPEGKEIFFRKKLIGPLVFTNDPKNAINDFDFFHAIERSPTMCSEIKIEIFKLCQNNYVLDWQGYFTTAMGKFDVDECVFEITPEPDDKYRCLLSNINKEINILDVANLHESQADLDIGAVYEYFYVRGNGIACTINNPLLPVPINSWQGLHQETDNDANGDKICIYFRERLTTNCVAGIASPPPGSGWQLLEDNCAIDGTADYVRRPTPGTTNPNPRVLRGMCDSGTALPPPPPVFKTVTLVTPPALTGTRTDTIRGYRLVAQTVSSDYDYDVIGYPGSTFLWSLSGGAGMTITSGTGTNQVSVHLGVSFGAQTLICTETTSCGDTITHSINVQAGTLTPNTRIFSGPVNICAGQLATWKLFDVYKLTGSIPFSVNHYFKIRLGPSGPNEVPLANYGTLLVNTRDELTIQFNGTPLPAFSSGYYMAWHAIWTACSPDCSVFDQQLVVVSNTPLTDDISGFDTACNSEVDVLYSVPNRPGSSYTWTVNGGTIDFGQGTNEIAVIWGGVDGDFEISVKEDIDCGCAYVKIVDCDPGVNDTPYWLCPLIKYNVTYSQNRSLQEVVEFMLDEINCSGLSGNVISDLFEWNPDGTAPGYVAGRNYVYGGLNQYSNLMIAQKSDVINPTASNPATIGLWTLRKLFDFLRSFDIYWIIDNAGNLRIEHFKFFPFPIGLDLTHPRWAEWMKKKNKYSHQSEVTPKYERWITESLYQDFVGQEIRYDALCVSQDESNNVVEYNIPDVTCDLNYIALQPNDIEKTGFVIMACDANDNVISDTGILSGLVLANQPMSVATLQDRFCRHNRYLPQGRMNGSLEKFDGFRPTINQVDISIPLCCENFNPNDAIITELGTAHLGGIKARVLSARYELYTGALTLKLGYSYANL